LLAKPVQAILPHPPIQLIFFGLDFYHNTLGTLLATTVFVRLTGEEWSSSAGYYVNIKLF
jgi:hypothetical protein